MSIDVFAPAVFPDNDMSVEFAPTQISHSFGDAYTQDATVGVNADMRGYSPQWSNLRKVHADYIIAFLASRKGSQSFYWTPNGEGTIKVFKCKKFTYKWKANRCTISANFTQAAPF